MLLCGFRKLLIEDLEVEGSTGFAPVLFSSGIDEFVARFIAFECGNSESEEFLARVGFKRVLGFEGLGLGRFLGFSNSDVFINSRSGCLMSFNDVQHGFVDVCVLGDLKANAESEVGSDGVLDKCDKLGHVGESLKSVEFVGEFGDSFGLGRRHGK